MNYIAVFTCSALDSQRPSLIAGPQMESHRSIKMRFIVKHGIFYVPLDMALANKIINQKRMERCAVHSNHQSKFHVEQQGKCWNAHTLEW